MRRIWSSALESAAYVAVPAALSFFVILLTGYVQIAIGWWRNGWSSPPVDVVQLAIAPIVGAFYIAIPILVLLLALAYPVALVLRLLRLDRLLAMMLLGTVLGVIVGQQVAHGLTGAVCGALLGLVSAGLSWLSVRWADA